MRKVVGPTGSVVQYANRKKSPKRRSGIFLLEPRVMYDGAAAASVAATAHHHDHHHHDHHHDPVEHQAAPPPEHSFAGPPAGGSDRATSSAAPTFSAPTTFTPGVEPSGLRPGNNVVFVDSQIANYQAIVSAINPGTTVFVFDGTKDGLQQIAQDLHGVHGLNSVDIISHGAVGEMQIGADTLTTGAIPTYAADLAAIGKALAPKGQLDLYGCDVAAAGDGFIDALKLATGRDVAASTTLIGATALGGTWTLDATTGPTPDALPANLAALQFFDNVLEAPTVTAGAAAVYNVGNPGVAVDKGITVSDSGGNLAGATVKIGAGFASGDTLNFTTQNGKTASPVSTLPVPGRSP